jgi:Cys-tRNA(Pro)/Cys-tRNA(Cys) deacylase
MELTRGSGRWFTCSEREKASSARATVHLLLPLQGNAGVKKTLAMRHLESRGVQYETVVFPDTIHDALGVAAHAGLPSEMVHKTLVVLAVDPLLRGKPRPLLAMIAAGRTLDLKKMARAAGVKRVEMAPQVEAERLTGLKVGGISALALVDRGFPVVLDEPARAMEEIVVSAGQRGLNLRLSVKDLVAVAGAQWADISREPQGETDDV